jgi:hypothetical protein
MYWPKSITRSPASGPVLIALLHIMRRSSV